MASPRAGAESIDTFLAGGIFPLTSHPDGGIAPPFYGLRLDGLDDDSGHEFTFDFDGPGAKMLMEIDPSDLRLRIFGRAFGGRVEGEAYLDPQLWEIDFTYTRMIVEGDRLVSDPTTSPNSGQIVPTESVGGFTAGVAIDLVDYFGKHDFTFALEKDHRGVEGFSGFGWVNHAGGGLDRHIAASDWLFTVIPEPRTDALMLLGLGGVVAVALRRKRSHSAGSSPG